MTRITVPLDISECTDCSFMFNNASSLVTISSITFGTKTAKPSSMFASCSALENITVYGTIAVDLTLAGCAKLSVASVESIVNAYAPGSYTLDLAASTIALLSDEIKQVAADKGLTIK
jgi:hypothetical protein